jgi:hypothetical protein
VTRAGGDTRLSGPPQHRPRAERPLPHLQRRQPPILRRKSSFRSIRSPLSGAKPLLARMRSGVGSDAASGPAPMYLHPPGHENNEETEPEGGQQGIPVRRLHLPSLTPQSTRAYPCWCLNRRSSRVRPRLPQMPSALQALARRGRSPPGGGCATERPGETPGYRGYYESAVAGPGVPSVLPQMPVAEGGRPARREYFPVVGLWGGVASSGRGDAIIPRSNGAAPSPRAVWAARGFGPATFVSSPSTL